MKKNDALKDILQNRTTNQIFYNENLIKIRNPEIRQLFTQLRDDELRSIVKLQQKLLRLDTPEGIISKIFPFRSKF